MSQESDEVKSGGKVPQNRSLSLVALGSNMHSEIGDPASTLHEALIKLQNLGAVIRGKSRLFRTPAFPPGSGPDFVNAAVAVQCHWSARELMTHLHSVEAALGRRRVQRWEQRQIDLDLLAMGSDVRPDMATLRVWMDIPLEQQQDKAPGQLILPHPRMHQRAFVLVPLADVAPDWVHPGTRRSVAQMLEALPDTDKAEVVPLEQDW